MLDVLADNPLLTIFLAVGLGTLLGAIPFGPVRFGPAGALFVGLALGAADERLGDGLALVQSLGLALFVYTVGVASGAAFFRGLRRQLPLMAGSMVVLALATLVALLAGRALGIAPDFRGGVFAGALTSTPTLAAAIARTGSGDPAVGYSLCYPVGVAVAILAVASVLARPRPSRRDPAPMAASGLVDLSVDVRRRVRLSDVPGVTEKLARFSYLARDGHTRVVTPDEELLPGDRVVVVGPEPAVQRVVDFLGPRVSEHLAHDRSVVDYRRVLLSNPAIAGRTLEQLDIPGRFGGIVTRIRRGDLDLLAADDTVVELGDRLRVVVPRGELRAVSAYLGDSERKVSEIDALSLGIGMALGFLVGVIALPLPGGVRLSLGAAAGPLVVGMILGRVERTGPIVWGLPTGANVTIRQLGLLLFLAAVGLSSGQAFISQAFSMLGLKIVLAGAATVAVACAAMILLTRLLDASTARSAGAVSGFIGQPAVLAYANGRVIDERVDAGYATLFAVDLITKVLFVQVLVGLS
jgi:putative transport protein